jgi:hypothetical protein
MRANDALLIMLDANEEVRAKLKDFETGKNYSLKLGSQTWYIDLVAAER